MGEKLAVILLLAGGQQKAEPANAAKAASPARAPHTTAQPTSHGDANSDPSTDATDVTPSGAVRTETLADMSIDVPKEWKRVEPRSKMRLAEFSIPGPGGAATLAVFRFAGGGGGTQANIDRWVGQFTQPDGSKTKDKARIETGNVGPLKITTLDVRGTFKGMAMPGAPPQPAVERARMLAAVVEGHGDALYLKLNGTAKTVDLWAVGWATATKTIRGPEACGDNTCTPPEQCLTVVGRLENAPVRKECWIPCDEDDPSSCPQGMVCSMIHDGPGVVCIEKR